MSRACHRCEGEGLVRANRLLPDGKYQFRKIPCTCSKGIRLDRDALRAELSALRAEGMPPDRDALQGLLDSAYNKGRDDVHALYQTGAPIALLRAELDRTKGEIERVVSALKTMLVPVDAFGNHGGKEWGYHRDHAQKARAVLAALERKADA